MRKLLFVLSLVVLGAGGARAQAIDEEGNFNAERLRPSMDRNGLIDVENAAVGEHLTYDVSLWGGYALNPLVLISTTADDTRTVNALVAHRLGANVVASISLFDWVQVGLDVPVVLFQARDTASFEDQVASKDMSAVGLGELRLSPKVRILRQADQFVDLAVMPTVTAPTALPQGNYFGDTFFTFVPEVLVGRSFGPVRVVGNMGARLRQEEQFLNLTVGPELLYRVGVGYSLKDFKLPAEVQASLSGVAALTDPLNKYQSGFEVLGGLAYDLPVLQNRLQVFGDVGVSPNAVFGMPTMRVLAGVRYAPRTKDADGDGIEDDKDSCKDSPEDMDGVADSDGCPETDVDSDGVGDQQDACNESPEDPDGFQDEDGCPDDDNDQDGIPDSADACRDAPEDMDGDRDTDGCAEEPADADGDGIVGAADRCPDQAGKAEDQGCPPADKDADGVPDTSDACVDVAGLAAFGGCPDTDKDGIADPTDKCPTEAEVINGVDDTDGCPDVGETKVKITAEKIEILDKVFFDTGKDVIQQRSFGILGQVASALRANPQITRIRVEGHTDNVGKPQENLDLSKRRAAAVKTFLVSQGIADSRLESEGYGDNRPSEPNVTKSGREKNRRVEFVIVEMDGKATGAAP